MKVTRIKNISSMCQVFVRDFSGILLNISYLTGPIGGITRQTESILQKSSPYY